jgi:replication factor C subunit 1
MCSPIIIRKVESPKATETTTSDYFGSSNKPKRSEPVKPKPAAKPPNTPPKPKESTPKPSSRPEINGKSTPIRTKKPTTAYSKIKPEVDFADRDNEDDIFTADFKPNTRADDYDEGTDEEEVAPRPRRVGRGHGRQAAKIQDPDDDLKDVDMKDEDSEDNFVVPDDEITKAKKASKTSKEVQAVKKRKSPVSEDEDEEDEPPKKARKKATTTKAPAKSKAKKDDEPESAEMQAIMASIPTVRAPTPPPRDGTNKFNFAAAASHAAASAVQGSTAIPEGAENCLAGLTFVFTGILSTLGREEGQALVKRYGGKCTTSVSKKTSFVVLGTDAGPKKLEVIHANKLKTINEEGLFELIRKLPANGGDSKAAAAYDEKVKKERAKMEEEATEQEKEERRRAKEAEKLKLAKAVRSGVPVPSKTNEPQVDSRLWTVKFAPTALNQICGNKANVEKLQGWLRNFPRNHKKKFKLPGADGMGVYRAVLISGPPGIGKTTAAHLVAKLEGYDIVENNASDTRSKKLVEEGLRGVLSTTSLAGYFAADGQKTDASKRKLVLIMDEVDGMSAGDRGGVGALAAVCKKTEVPMILICNDRKLPKMKPFDHCTFDLPFRRPTTDMIKSRMSTIAFRAGLDMPPPVLNALIEGSNADIRQIINMLSTAKLDQEVMEYDKAKGMSKAWEKHVVLKPWDITSKIIGGGMFASSSTATLNDKIELYFNDHDFAPLMLAENYLGSQPIRAQTYAGKEKMLKTLELVSEAADSISDGDLVDRMIHGPQSQWALMPTHAIFSFVRPASFISGSMVGHQTRFTSWLGQNSKQSESNVALLPQCHFNNHFLGKLTRVVKEIQGHMRLRSSGDRHEVRQQYVPALWNKLVKRLEIEGKEAVPKIIDLMDSYFLTRDDFDGIQELGVGYMDMEKIKIETQAKATFTRMYNAASHPLAFLKGSTIGAPKKMTKDKPDLEEALDESDDEESIDAAVQAEEEEEVDITKDKYIKAPKKKKTAPQRAAAGKGKKRKGDDEESDEAPKPKKGKARAKK